MSISTKVFRLLNLNTKYRFPLRIQECQFKRSLRPVLVEFKKRQDRADFKAVIPKLPNHRNTYLEWNYDSEIYAFGKRLKEEFDPQLLRTAFTHRSYIIQQEMKQRDLGIENPDIKLQDNRQLIEEGEAFMREYIVTFLEAALPKFPLEGILVIRDHLMKTELLADVASHLGCKDIILSQEYPVTEEILSNTFKAIVSALIQSSDEARAGHFVRDFVITMLHHQDVNELWTVERPMELLQELMKKAEMNEPELRLISESAKNTILACYRVGIYVDKNLFCDSFGENIPIAKEMAAREGLKIFFGTPDNMVPINYRLQVLPKQRTTRTKSIQAS